MNITYHQFEKSMLEAFEWGKNDAWETSVRDYIKGEWTKLCIKEVVEKARKSSTGKVFICDEGKKALEEMTKND